MTTFADVLARRIGDDPGRPLVTYYDLRPDQGERVELSVATYANWVAKSASLLADEHGLERGQRLRVDLPTHWLGPVFLGAAWTVGLCIVDGGVTDDEPDAVVCGPAMLEHWAAYADRIPVLACALLPLGVRFTRPLPAGVHDVGVEVWGQPDAFTPWDPPRPDDLAVAWAVAGGLTQEQVASRPSHPSPGGVRLLSTTNPASPSGLTAFTEPVADGGSLVLVAGAEDATRSETHREAFDDAVARVFADERCTARFSPPRGTTGHPARS